MPKKPKGPAEHLNNIISNQNKQNKINVSECIDILSECCTLSCVVYVLFFVRKVRDAAQRIPFELRNFLVSY